MTFYFALFLLFLYFKIARVHKKEENTSTFMMAQNLFVALCGIAILTYGIFYLAWYLFVPSLFVFATIASLMITAIQIGVFVDGKPIFGLSHIYKYLPYLTLVLFVFTTMSWFFKLYKL